VWEATKANGGFSDAEPWLPVPDEHLPLSVAEQEKKNDSLLHFYRKVIAFRKQHPVLAKGAQSDMTVDGNVVSFTRTLDGMQMFCAFNIGQQAATVYLPGDDWRVSELELGTSTTIQSNKAELQANQALIATKI